MNEQEAETYKVIATIIAILIGVISTIIWLIFTVQGNNEATRLKHSTCTVETTYFNDGKTPEKVIAYCGGHPDE